MSATERALDAFESEADLVMVRYWVEIWSTEESRWFPVTVRPVEADKAKDLAREERRAGESVRLVEVCR